MTTRPTAETREQGPSPYYRQWLHFSGHFTSYVPTLIIVFMASLVVGVSEEKVISFLFFTFSTVSLEVCITCLRAKFVRVWLLQKKLIVENDAGQRIRIANDLQRAGTAVGQCMVYVGIVFVSWIVVAFVEVADISKIQLSSVSRPLACSLAGVNVLFALFKMWVHAGEVAADCAPLRLVRAHRPQVQVSMAPR